MATSLDPISSTRLRYVSGRVTRAVISWVESKLFMLLPHALAAPQGMSSVKSYRAPDGPRTDVPLERVVRRKIVVEQRWPLLLRVIGLIPGTTGAAHHNLGPGALEVGDHFGLPLHAVGGARIEDHVLSR